MLSGIVSEKAAWIRRGFEEEKRGWPRPIERVPEHMRGAYNQGRRRAREQG